MAAAAASAPCRSTREARARLLKSTCTGQVPPHTPTHPCLPLMPGVWRVALCTLNDSKPQFYTPDPRHEGRAWMHGWVHLPVPWAWCAHAAQQGAWCAACKARQQHIYAHTQFEAPTHAHAHMNTPTLPLSLSLHAQKTPNHPQLPPHTTHTHTYMHARAHTHAAPTLMSAVEQPMAPDLSKKSCGLSFCRARGCSGARVCVCWGGPLTQHCARGMCGCGGDQGVCVGGSRAVAVPVSGHQRVVAVGAQGAQRPLLLRAEAAVLQHASRMGYITYVPQVYCWESAYAGTQVPLP